MPEKKAQPVKVKTTVIEKPVVKKTAVKATTAAAKPKAIATKTAAIKAPTAKAPAAKAKVAVAAKPEVVEVKTPKTVEEPKAVVQPKAVEQPKAVAAVAKPAAKPEPKKVIKGKVLKITLLKSGIGYSKRHKRTLKALGFHHLHQTIEQPDSPSIRGMLALVYHLVRIEEQGTK